jgi:hypothetical protein
MKKILLVAAVAFALASCKKDYSCACTTTMTDYDNGVATVGATSSADVSVGKQKKKDAEDKCKAMSSEAMVGDTDFGIKSSTECKLK